MKRRNKLDMLALNKRLIKELMQNEPVKKEAHFASKSTSKDIILKYKIRNQF